MNIDELSNFNEKRLKEFLQFLIKRSSNETTVTEIKYQAEQILRHIYPDFTLFELENNK